jgi:hypothetical protein
MFTKEVEDDSPLELWWDGACYVVTHIDPSVAMMTADEHPLDPKV